MTVVVKRFRVLYVAGVSHWCKGILAMWACHKIATLGSRIYGVVCFNILSGGGHDGP